MQLGGRQFVGKPMIIIHSLLVAIQLPPTPKQIKMSSLFKIYYFNSFLNIYNQTNIKVSNKVNLLLFISHY